MTSRTVSFTAPIDLYRHIRICADAVGVSPSAFIRGAVQAAVAEVAGRDEGLRLYLDALSHWTRPAESVRS